MAHTTPRLEFVGGAGDNRVPVDLVGSELTIGSSPSCTLRLEAAGIADQHARLTIDGSGDAWIEDVGSMSGTVINGNTISEKMQLRDGDEIEIGVATLRFRAGAPAQTEAAKVGTETSTLISTDVPDIVKQLIAKQEAARAAAATGTTATEVEPAPTPPSVTVAMAEPALEPAPTPPSTIVAEPAGVPVPGAVCQPTLMAMPAPMSLPTPVSQPARAHDEADQVPVSVVVGAADPEPLDGRTVMQMQVPDYAAMGYQLPPLSQPANLRESPVSPTGPTQPSPIIPIAPTPLPTAAPVQTSSPLSTFDRTIRGVGPGVMPPAAPTPSSTPLMMQMPPAGHQTGDPDEGRGTALVEAPVRYATTRPVRKVGWFTHVVQLIKAGWLACFGWLLRRPTKRN